jgi:hypothetical protein
VQPANGASRLEEALATLIQNQAAFVGRLAETDARFARIEAQIAEIIRVLNTQGQVLAEHGRLLERLPEAVRERMGFKPPPAPTP